MCDTALYRAAAAVLLVIAAPANVQSQTPGTPPDPRIDSIFAPWDGATTPGCALGVYRDGQVVYARGYGMADLERNVPITPRTVFDLGSTSKQFAAASVVLLALDGSLSLDDDVRDYVPELPAYSRPITIRHLLYHTSGLRDYIGLLVLGGARIDDVTTAADALATVARQKELNFEPGDEHLYSNTGYFLLSIIVERVTGESLRDFARQRIFEPLGMAHTQYLDSYADLIPHRAVAYSATADGRLRQDMPRWLQLGDGAVFSTVEDLLHWDSNFYEPKVGGAALLAELHRRGRLTSGDSLFYAGGIILVPHRGQRTVRHGGAWGGYRAELVRFPDQHFSVATLCNSGEANPYDLALRVADVYLADVLETPPSLAAAAPGRSRQRSVTVTEEVLRSMTGVYRNTASGATRTVLLEEGRPYVTGAGRFEMRPVSATEFELVDAAAVTRVVFDGARRAAPSRMTWLAEGRDGVVFERLDIVTPTVDELAQYTGAYHSEELDATYVFGVSDDALVLRRRSAESQRLRPMVRDEFTAGSLILRFTRGDDGVVDGLTLHIGRVRNVRFERTHVGEAR